MVNFFSSLIYHRAFVSEFGFDVVHVGDNKKLEKNVDKIKKNNVLD